MLHSLGLTTSRYPVGMREAGTCLPGDGRKQADARCICLLSLPDKWPIRKGLYRNFVCSGGQLVTKLAQVLLQVNKGLATKPFDREQASFPFCQAIDYLTDGG